MPRIKPGPPCRLCGKPSEAQDLCSMHYSRFLRHGHCEQTRPKGWGQRSDHPLKDRWVNVKQQGCPQRWREDFWGFAADIGDPPHEGAQLRRRDKSQPHSPDNTYWHVPRVRLRDGYQANEARKLQLRLSRKANPLAHKEYDLKKKYGLILQDYDHMLEAQQGKCAICKGPPTTFGRLVVDHCHNTKKVRALLCSHCNRALGGFRDNLETVLSAAQYLESHGG